MKITCTQENFKKAIYNTERVIGKQATLPILENILLETEKGMLRISATNLEIGVFLKIGAKIEKEGKITIPARLISSLINNLPAGDNIQLETNNQTLKITSGSYKANVKGLSAQDFPIIPEVGGEFLFSLPAQNLKDIISKILTCVSIDNTRPELGGVNLLLDEKKANLAATDSFRLLEAEIELKIENSENYKALISKINSVIVPANTFAEVLRAISPETTEVKVVIEENQIFFQVDNVRIVSRLINGKYPAYKSIIPQEFSTKAFIDKEDLLRAVKIASLFTNNKSGEVNFKLDSEKGEVDVFAQSEEKGENKTRIKAGIDGQNQEIVFNPKYFIDGVNSISSLEVAFLGNSSSTPVVLRNIDKNGDKMEVLGNLTYVVMPIKN